MTARRSCNVLVIGGGLAGIQAAEGAAQFVSHVLVVDGRLTGEPPATRRDAGVLAAYLAQDAGGTSDWKSSRVSLSVQEPGGKGHPADTTAIHRGYHAYLDDMARHGGQLGDPELADFTAAGVYNRIGWLESYGLHVVRDQARAYRGFAAPGHALNRMLLIEEPAREVLARIRESAVRFGATCAEGLYVTRLLVEDGRVAGAYALDVQSGEPVVIETGAVILAAGGADRLYRAEASATAGAGYQLALDAGAELASMEFVAFGPEAISESELPPALLLALLGLGARLQRDGGVAVGADAASLAQLIREVAEATRRGRVWLQLPPELPAALAELPPFRPHLSRLERALEVRVGCLGLLGGVVHRVFTAGVEGLFVAGAAATGCHGADLLPGVDTSFTLYSAENAATAAATYWSRARPPGLSDRLVKAEEQRVTAMRSRPREIDPTRLAEIEDAVRAVMWEHVGPERTGRGLGEASRRLREVATELETVGAGTGARLVSLCEAQALVATAELVCQAASAREETRGQHARLDFPALDERGGRSWITVARRDGALTWGRLPVPGGRS